MRMKWPEALTIAGEELTDEIDETIKERKSG
jgi:hypothetical protein